MCGRYTLHKQASEIAKRFGLDSVPKGIIDNYNVAPGQIMPVIVSGGDMREFELMKWGLIPRWSKDAAMGYRLINARDDTIFNKPVWRSIILHKRALVPADGFFEWQRPANTAKPKRPYYIRPKDQELFAFAGIWEGWTDSEGRDMQTFSIITTDANREMRKIHNRMPVILHNGDEAEWLSSSRVARKDIEPFLHPYEDDGLQMHEVSRSVNLVRNNDATLIHPINSR